MYRRNVCGVRRTAVRNLLPIGGVQIHLESGEETPQAGRFAKSHLVSAHGYRRRSEAFMSAVFDIGPGADIPKTFESLGTAIRMLLADGPVRIVMERLTHKRTHSQNDMHCGLCRDIAEALKERTGLDYDVEYMRAKTKRKFGVVVSQPDPETGKAEPYLMSTTKYSKEQFSKLIDGTLS